MTDLEMEDAYQRFSRVWGDTSPIRAAREFAATVRAAGIAEEDVTDEWLRSLRSEWVYGDSDDPFYDPRANLDYRRELRGNGG